MKVISPNTLPEVKQFDRLRRCVCEDVLLQVALCKFSRCTNHEHMTGTDYDPKPTVWWQIMR